MKLTLFTLCLFFHFSCFSQETNTKSPDTLIVIDKAPVYKNCDKNMSNADLKRCMMSELNAHIGQRFNTKVARGLGLPSGVVRIKVFFDVSEKGKIVNVTASGPHIKLEKEAIRVLKSAPRFKQPGYIKDRPVNVSYVIPIAFAL
jgi:hypothetical protein